ncbi:DNA-processing protein DprA [bacterium]|nr:DNA-processing protein DprA [bacterium]
MNNFKHPRNIWEAPIKELYKTGIKKNVFENFLAQRKKFDKEKAWEELKKEEIKMITRWDKKYPKLLLETYDPPNIIYYRGNFNLTQKPCLAVVGSRKYSYYGKQIVEKIIKDLVNSYEIVIVSGLALGIDTLSHKITMEQETKTIAVLGSGINKRNVYPAQNQSLCENLIKNGNLVLSEFPPKTPALKHHFPQRNRVISGLSLGALIIEAGEKSGSLITARFSLEQNREVLSIPGNIFSPVSKGTNKLIKMGAKGITSSEDIAEELNLTKKEKFAINNNQSIKLSKEEEIIISNINGEPKNINQIIKESKMKSSIVNSNLSLMEIKGLIKNIGNAEYIKL